jgi:hypothetical protein
MLAEQRSVLNPTPATALTAPSTQRVDTRLIVGLVGLAFLTIVVFIMLARYEGQAGPVGEAPTFWPEASAISRGATRPTLLLFVHPECPCTRASIHELAAALEGRANDVELVIVRVGRAIDSELAPQSRGALARALPGARVVDDPEAIEAERFGARTSGHALLFDMAGRRLYSGGLTLARGHEGNSFARVALIAALDGHHATGAPIYGCQLANESREDAR